jgi:crossover junction endonuclease MUS81
MLILDTREIKLIELIKTNSIVDSRITYVIENLQIGDIIIRHSSNLSNVSCNVIKEVTYNLIIERKYVTDMIASIKDGRYKEQKVRLLSEIAKNTETNKTIVCYILEGSQNELRLAQDKVMLNGSIISSIFRDKIPVIRTYTLQETFDIILRLHDRLIKEPADFFTILDHNSIPNSIPILENNNNNDNNNGDGLEVNKLYLQSIKKCKKDNLTPQTWNHMCYMNIPGISSNIAMKIAEIYPSIKLLVEAYTKCSSEVEKEMLLAEIVLTETEKQKRRIGHVISKRVYEYLST